MGYSCGENGGLNSPRYSAPPKWECPCAENIMELEDVKLAQWIRVSPELQDAAISNSVSANAIVKIECA